MEEPKKTEPKKAFAERHPIINKLVAIIILFVVILIGLFFIKYVFILIGKGVAAFEDFLKRVANSTDTVVIVAMITGCVSIIGVVISSIIAKIVDYRFNVKKYLYNKREVPYEQFINMYYQIMEDTKKPESEKTAEAEVISMMSEFSRGLTLWGSNRVAKKWIKYRKQCQSENTQNLFYLEDIIYEMRRDVGFIYFG